ncbi:MAG: type IV pili methyl-accepting chemotaxis transducer N-terminal domain-containing protein [Magnetococcales bacterium]|nr:type IV pili methyl-accepting chemotaxis transducer N-terminal domain-containing protein [Magnetococcales bacterium]
MAVLVVVYGMTQEMREDGDTINLTGRQRMLSQKMVKEFLVYSHDRQKVHLVPLQGSVQVFDETLRALLTGGMASRTLDRNNPELARMSQPTPAIKAQLEQAQAIWRPLMTQLQRLGQDERADLASLQRELLAASDQLLQDMNRASILMAQKASDHVDSIVHAVLVAGIVALIVTVFVLLRIRTINRSLDRLCDSLRTMAGGQLTHRITDMDQSTELGQLAHHANQLADSFIRIGRTVMVQARSLGASVQEIVESKNHLAQDSHENHSLANAIVLSHNMVTDHVVAIQHSVQRTTEQVQEMAVAASQLAGSIDAIAAAAEQANINIHAIAAASSQITTNLIGINSNMEQVDQSAGAVSREIQEMIVSLAHIRDLCHAASLESSQVDQQAQGAGAAMQRLSTSADEIDEVLVVINKIAEHTGLLALNASIEAAGAGETGRGFAIVASEIKDLAKQTKDATHMISERVREIQSQINATAIATKQVNLAIRSINKSNRDISYAVDDQSATIQRIAAAVEHVAGATGEVTDSIRELNQASGNVARSAMVASSGTDEIAQSAGDISRTAADLAQRNQEVSQTSQTVADAAQQMGDSIHAANEQLRQIFHNITLIDGAIHHVSLLIDTSREPGKRLDQSIQSLDIGREPFDIAAVKSAHLQWLGRMENVIRGRLVLQPDEVVDAHHCHFGLWYDQDGQRQFSHWPLFGQLGQVHGTVHDIARETVRLVSVGSTGEAVVMMNQFATVKDQLFDLLDQLYLMAMEYSVQGEPSPLSNKT